MKRFFSLKRRRLSCVIIILGLVFIPGSVHAAPLQSNTYTLEPGKMEQVALIKPSVTISEENKPFRLTVSSDTIDFGPITPTNPTIRYINTSVLHDPLFSYDLFAFEDHPLSNCHPERSEGSLSSSEHPTSVGDSSPPAQNDNCAVIPDTSCDTGTCNQKESALWLNPLTFGFGYSLGNDEYKRFANLASHEDWVNLDRQSDEIKITTKLNVSRDFEAKVYQNTVTFVAIPKL